jgi:hypothetical protein
MSMSSPISRLFLAISVWDYVEIAAATETSMAMADMIVAMAGIAVALFMVLLSSNIKDA